MCFVSVCVYVCVCVCVCVCACAPFLTPADATLNNYCLIINIASLYKGMLLFVYTHNQNKTEFNQWMMGIVV